MAKRIRKSNKPPRVNKKEEYRLARMYYVEHGLTAKETAIKVGVSETTLLKWVNAADGAWKVARNAKFLSSDKQEANIKEILNDLAEERLKLTREIKVSTPDEAKDLRGQMAAIDDGAAKWNKVLQQVKKENAIVLPVYLQVMREIMDDLRAKQPKLYEQILKCDFEQEHILNAASKYK